MTDVLVIGAGAAGMTAALYALRNGKSVTVLEKNNIGGQISESPRVENFPTIKTITGADFADRLFEQITEHGAEFKFGKVEKVEKIDDVFYVTTEFDTLQAKSVVIACGVEHRKLHLEKEDEFVGHGISFCALCDGAFYANENVVLIGDGNTALQYALLLSSYCKSVNVVTMFDRFFGDEALICALEKKENIVVTHNAQLVKLLGQNELEGLVFKRTNGEEFDIATKGLFVAIGQVPNNKVFENLVDLKNGYFVCDENMATKTAGVFVAGDCRDKKVRQLTTACSDGAIAATSACNYLQTL